MLADRCWRSIVCSTVCRAMACVAAGGAAPAVGRQPAARLVGVPGQDRDPAAVRHTSTLYTSLSHAFPTHFPPDEQTQPTPTQLYGSHAITPVGDRALFRARVWWALIGALQCDALQCDAHACMSARDTPLQPARGADPAFQSDLTPPDPRLPFPSSPLLRPFSFAGRTWRGSRRGRRSSG